MSSALLKLNLHAVATGRPKFKVKIQIADKHIAGAWQTIGNMSMSRSELRVFVAMLATGARHAPRIFTCTGNEGEAALALAVLEHKRRKDIRPDVSTTKYENDELNPLDESPNERRERESLHKTRAPVEPHRAEYYEFLYGPGTKK